MLEIRFSFFSFFRAGNSGDYKNVRHANKKKKQVKEDAIKYYGRLNVCGSARDGWE